MLYTGLKGGIGMSAWEALSEGKGPPREEVVARNGRAAFSRQSCFRGGRAALGRTTAAVYYFRDRGLMEGGAKSGTSSRAESPNNKW